MAIHLTKNPYQGINAHFNSYLQNVHGGWVSFHSAYIVYLKDALNRVLPEGYYAVSEQSLQIEAPSEYITTRPDVSIMRHGRTNSTATASGLAPTPLLEVAADMMVDEEDYLHAVEIYYMIAADESRPVTRLEVITPSNKPPNHYAYLIMRQRTISLHINLVELDYVHEKRSMFHQVLPWFREVLPDYTRHEADSHPFYMMVTSPNVNLTRFYGFDVDQPIPALTIPLAGNDSVLFDFNAVYQQTFENDRRAHVLIDYAEEPMNFAAYNAPDQQKIRARINQLSNEE